MSVFVYVACSITVVPSHELVSHFRVPTTISANAEALDDRSWLALQSHELLLDDAPAVVVAASPCA